MTNDDMLALLNMTDEQCADVLEKVHCQFVGGRHCGKTFLKSAYDVALARAISKLRGTNNE